MRLSDINNTRIKYTDLCYCSIFFTESPNEKDIRVTRLNYCTPIKIPSVLNYNQVASKDSSYYRSNVFLFMIVDQRLL